MIHESAPHLQEASGHGSASAVHQAVEAEAVVGVCSLAQDVQCSLGRAVEPHVLSRVVQRELEFAELGRVSADLAERQNRCSIK